MHSCACACSRRCGLASYGLLQLALSFFQLGPFLSPAGPFPFSTRMQELVRMCCLPAMHRVTIKMNAPTS